MTVHALGPDKEHCVCGELWPDAGWWAQQRDIVKDTTGLQVALDTYPDASPPARARLEAAWIGGAHGSEQCPLA